METVKSTQDIGKLEKNKVTGNPEIHKSQITFKGENNILYCEGNVKLNGAKFLFEGSNSIIYLSSSQNTQYSFTLVIYNDSTFFIGREGNLSSPININIQESQNVIIGAECSLSSGVNIRTADIHPIYDNRTKQRINYANSVFIGDHVWIGHLAYISRGVKIGSGAIIENDSFLPHNAKIPSNTLVVGNPARIERDNVFFTREFLGYHNSEDSLNTQDYKSDVFIYEFVNQETLNLNQIDKILKDLNTTDRLEFIQKLFVRNKRKNRFTITK
ncbi:MAG: acetyltransferase [Methanobrevibacter sp.]|jgi:acetyltransferase-like isoleucine patch superfamily enzyme|uniref:acetyltransferase n=1 Tax=Methanobrevibacter sp. TaxID=66852 RepID=UPI0025F5840F|nr:acetyltransferase [Methanobrevibacter sp.]MBE6497285.1 acetyltransferase [Methanobrevibacter sp.]